MKHIFIALLALCLWSCSKQEQLEQEQFIEHIRVRENPAQQQITPTTTTPPANRPLSSLEGRQRLSPDPEIVAQQLRREGWVPQSGGTQEKQEGLSAWRWVKVESLTRGGNKFVEDEKGELSIQNLEIHPDDQEPLRKLLMRGR